MKSTNYFGKLLWIALLFITTTVLSYQAAAYPASSYSFTPLAGTFTEITGGTSVSVIEADEDYSGSLPIGFTFNYCGIPYTDFVVGSNGWLSFAAPNGSYSWNDQTEINSIKPALFPLWEDLSGDGGEASYIVTGTAPNRVLTMQFKNWLWTWSASSPVISFQVKLYETTNVIEYVYRQESGSISGWSWSINATIGIADGDAVPNFLTLNNTSSAPVASSTTFNTGIGSKPANGQIYRFTPPPNCAGAIFPVAGPATVFPTSVCLSGIVNLSISTAMPVVTDLTYQWQSAPAAAGPWTSIAPPDIFPSQSTTVSAPLYFRCRVLCNGDSLAPVWTSTPTAQITVNNPGTAVGNGASRCGPGTLTLTATGTAGGPQLKWYTAPAGGAPIGAGSPWTTPFVPTTTTFYVTAGSPDVNGTQAIGAGALTTNWDEFKPFYGAWSGGYKHQYLILPSELLALGITPGTIITSLAFDVVSAGNSYDGFAISLKNTGTTAFDPNPLSLESGAQLVKTPASITTTVGINTFVFDVPTPFVWDGSTLMVQTCWSNGSNSTNNSEVKYDDVPFAASQFGFGDNLTPVQICDNPPFMGWQSVEKRPKMILGYTASCQGPRVPVVATVTPSPGLTVTAPDVICHETTAPITVVPQGTPYSTYEWTPAPASDLFTDPAATVPYVAGNSATSLFFKSPDAGEHVYYLFAENTTTNCNHADTVRIWNQPGGITIKAIPDTICNSGTATMTLVPATDYYPGSIQWQDSTVGVNFADIAGANDPAFTTPVIADNHYYKAVIRAGATICESPVQSIIVAHPVMISTKDSFNCGPGVVTLEAVTGGFSNVKWYDSPTASQPVGGGSPFETPFLGTTTTYYVAASTGVAQPEPTVIGSGTFTSSWTDVPYCLNSSGNKVQWLINAADLSAAGFNEGFINSIGFEVENAGDAVENFTLSMKLTSLTILNAPLETNMQTVFSTPSYQPIGNTTNVHVLDAPFYWDGTSNIILEECHSNASWGSSSSVVMDWTGSSMYNSSDNSDHCTNPGGQTWTSSTIPNIRIEMQGPCESAREEVTAHIRPVPIVDLGIDINKCVDPGEETVVLDAGVQPNNATYLWDDGVTTSQVRAVHQNGNYSVEVTNEYGCSKEDDINVIFRHNPIVHLGNDTSVCNGVTLKLDAGTQGIEYFWSTGATTSSITVSTAGSYNVFVTNGEGCIKTDTITISMNGQLPTTQGINIVNNGLNTFTFSPVNPQNVLGYEWDFGDGTPHEYTMVATHPYANPGNYIVLLYLSSSCGFGADSMSAHILGINQLNLDNSEMMVYPNPTKESATILNKSSAKMEEVSVYNVLGQVIYRAKADSIEKHTLKLEGLSSGIYTVYIMTNKGSVTRKLEIIR
ncbi:MAG: T9SS type A sorting domain-containing protein [Taibaiella sp.]